MTNANKGALVLISILWASIIPFIFGDTTIYSPQSTPLIISAFLIGYFINDHYLTIYFIIFIIPVAGFWLSLIPTFRGHSNLSQTQLISIIAIIVLNIGWAFFNWDYGFKYQGETHTIIVTILNILIGICLIGYFIYYKNRGTIRNKIFLNGMIWIWLLWYSFPVFGELP